MDHFPVLQKSRVRIFHKERHPVVSNEIQDLMDQLVGRTQSNPWASLLLFLLWSSGCKGG